MQLDGAEVTGDAMVAIGIFAFSTCDPKQLDAEKLFQKRWIFRCSLSVIFFALGGSSAVTEMVIVELFCRVNLKKV